MLPPKPPFSGSFDWSTRVTGLQVRAYVSRLSVRGRANIPRCDHPEL